MAYESEQKTSAELQHEVELQRTRVESTIDQIQERLSPGQLVDELLAYTKGGGGEFVSSLQRSVTANPLPVALIGASLVWLMAKPASATTEHATDRQWDNSINKNRGYGDGYDDDDYPVAVIDGSSLLHTSTSKDSSGASYSEFADAAGKKFKAMSDESGKRAGHFVDEAGNTFRGFVDSTGNKVAHFRDDAGSMIEDATGWAAHNWQKAREKLHDARDGMGSQGASAGAKAGEAGAALRHQADKLNQTILTQFRDQPLVGGALAFAVGAALAATLPHTPQEDALMGAAADELKSKAGEQVADVYAQGKDKAEDVYRKVSESASDLYGQAKEGLAKAVDTSNAADKSH